MEHALVVAAVPAFVVQHKEGVAARLHAREGRQLACARCQARASLLRELESREQRRAHLLTGARLLLRARLRALQT